MLAGYLLRGINDSVGAIYIFATAPILILRPAHTSNFFFFCILVFYKPGAWLAILFFSDFVFQAHAAVQEDGLF